jgi:hypothetical protein
MTEMNDWNDRDRRIIEEFRANGGNVGGQFAGVPFLLLTTTGALPRNWCSTTARW